MDTSKLAGAARAASQSILVLLVAFCGDAYAYDAWDNTKCREYEAYGGYKDTETGAGSGMLKGKSFNCFNDAVVGAGFETEDLRVVVHSCRIEKYCVAAGVKPGVAYVMVSRDGKQGDFRSRGKVIEADNKRTKVRQLNSSVIYSWVDGQELREREDFTVISNEQ